MSRVVCGTHLRLLAPGTMLLLLQWMLHWRRANCSTACETLLRTHHTRPQGTLPSLRRDPTGIETDVAASVVGAQPTVQLIQYSIKKAIILRMLPVELVLYRKRQRKYHDKCTCNRHISFQYSWSTGKPWHIRVNCLELRAWGIFLHLLESCHSFYMWWNGDMRDKDLHYVTQARPIHCTTWPVLLNKQAWIEKQRTSPQSADLWRLIECLCWTKRRKTWKCKGKWGQGSWRAWSSCRHKTVRPSHELSPHLCASPTNLPWRLRSKFLPPCRWEYLRSGVSFSNNPRHTNRQSTGEGAGKFLGVRKIFARISPNLQFFVRIFSPTQLMKTFFGDDFQKKVSMWYCKRWTPSFEIQQGWAPFLPVFSGSLQTFSSIFHGFCPDYRHVKTSGGALAPPPPTPLSQSNSKHVIKRWLLTLNRVGSCYAVHTSID